jgi:hypothetical protein
MFRMYVCMWANKVNLESRSDLMIGKWTSGMESEDAVRTEKAVGDRQAGRQTTD